MHRAVTCGRVVPPSKGAYLGAWGGAGHWMLGGCGGVVTADGERSNQHHIKIEMPDYQFPLSIEHNHRSRLGGWSESFDVYHLVVSEGISRA